MSKAPAPASADEFDGDNENEKTTLESGWEDEASTTIEQGEVAEKIRSMVNEPARRSITNVTNTNGAGLDEPTVDDQRAKAELSMITPAIARLLITQGNDTGQQLEIKPGKSYTIGRGIDNDFVLTDIAVSRKHFDLRHEAGEWVVADRGSGNGTVVNGTIEDQPFVLANGDTIEIGNTTFRFDHPNGAARHSLNSTFDLDGEESSTVAGKPIRDDIATPAQRLSPLPPVRAKTIPPPAPLRPRTPSAAPSYGYGAQGSIPPPNLPLPSPATTLPLPGMANGSRAPVLGAQQPTMLGDSNGVRPHMLASHNGIAPLANMMPTTIPGQGPNQLHQHGYGYPSASDMPHQHVQIAQLNGNPRDATSTALVQPSPYGSHAMAGGSPYVAPQLSRRTKLMLGGAALALFAAISTVAIIKNTSKRPAPAKGSGKSSAPIVEPIKDDKAAVPDPVKPPAAPTAPTAGTKPAPTVATKPPTIASTTPTPPTTTTSPTATPTIATKPEPTIATKLAKPPPTVATKPEPTKPPTVATKPTPAKPERRKPTREKPTPTVTERTPERTTERAPKRTAAASDTSDVKAKADSLYRAKKFADAAALLVNAASSIGGSEGSDLKSAAAVYSQVGRNYNLGMGPATKATEAFDALNKAANLDRGAGGAFSDEIRSKLATVAPRASVSFMAAKDYENAFKAVRTAESVGGGNASTKAVRDSLEARAGEIYAAAMRELESNPDGARQKLRQIKAIVDSKSPWAAKAQKALNGGG